MESNAPSNINNDNYNYNENTNNNDNYTTIPFNPLSQNLPLPPNHLSNLSSPPRGKSRSTSMSSEMGFGFHSPMQWLSSPFGALEPLSPSANSFSFVLNSPNQFLAALDAHNRDNGGGGSGVGGLMSPLVNQINDNNISNNSNKNKNKSINETYQYTNNSHNLNAIFSKINVEKSGDNSRIPSFSSPFGICGDNTYSDFSCAEGFNSSNSDSQRNNYNNSISSSCSAALNTSLTSENTLDNTSNIIDSSFVEGAQSLCNCKKSKCLKLYCECFTALRFCDGCKCVDCNNTEAHVKIRDQAIRSTKDRNSVAFQNKVTNQPGCNCKQSRCLKKYCECFHASALCGSNCKCQSCLNFEGSTFLHSARSSVEKGLGGFSATKEKRKSPSSVLDISPNTNINLNRMVLDASSISPENGDALNQSIEYSKSRAASSSAGTITNKTTCQKKKRKVMAPVLYPFFGPTAPPMEKIIALRILEFLTNSELYNVSQTNSMWNKAAMDEALWE